MRIVKIDDSNIGLLDGFIANLGESSKTFRYFNTRDVTVIKNHLATIMMTDDQGYIPYSYGHLEPFDNKIWLGICVSEDYVGKGFGKVMLNELIKIAKINKVEVISLSVDKDNISAIKLYEKNNFIRTTALNSHCFFYELKIN